MAHAGRRRARGVLDRKAAEGRRRSQRATAPSYRVVAESSGRTNADWAADESRPTFWRRSALRNAPDTRWRFTRMVGGFLADRGIVLAGPTTNVGQREDRAGR